MPPNHQTKAGNAPSQKRGANLLLAICILIGLGSCMSNLYKYVTEDPAVRERREGKIYVLENLIRDLRKSCDSGFSPEACAFQKEKEDELEALKKF